MLVSFESFSQHHDTQDIISIEQKEFDSPLVIDGYCINKELSVIDDEWYTGHHIKIDDFIKGNYHSDTIVVWSRGGETDTMGHVFPGEFNPIKNRRGRFFLSKRNDWYVSTYGIYGFVPRDNIKITENTHTRFKNLSINGLSIDTAIGNSEEVLVVQGSGFGSSRGNSVVSFNDWNGYQSIAWSNKLDYKSWSDSEIKVVVPQCISGPVKVILSNGSSVLSSDTLYIPANIYSAIGKPTGTLHHSGDNGTSGGYLWNIANNIYSDSVKWGLEDVFQQFICASQAHYALDSNPISASNNLSDGINAITFDNANNPLPIGTAARCNFTWYSCINNGDTLYWMGAIDIEFNSSYSTWYYGKGNTPPGLSSKFRYVLMHELGHSLRLGHTDMHGETMYPSVTLLPSQNWNMRDHITRSDSAASNNAAYRSSVFTFQGCGVTPITLLTNTCSGLGTDLRQYDTRLYPNPTNGIINIDHSEDFSYEVYDVLGKAVLKSVGNKRIDISTLPAGSYYLIIITEDDTSTFSIQKI